MTDRNRGLYEKFMVERRDGASDPGGKHHDCEYFVLDLDHDPHAAVALDAYADSCAAQYPALAADLRAKALTVRETHGLTPPSDVAAKDYEEVLADHRRLCRELDAVLSYPDEPARQASLCDLIPFAKSIAARARRYYWLNGQDNFLIQIDGKPVRLKCGDVLDRWIDARLEEGS